MAVDSIRWLFPMGLAAFLFFACAGGQLDSGGRKVEKERRIELETAGAQSGTWQGRHLKVEYRYTIENRRMTMEGRIVFPRRRLIDTFQLNLHITDAGGVILASDVLAAAPYRKMIETLSFDKALELPAGFEAMVFSYSGASRGLGEGAGSKSRFWQPP